MRATAVAALCGLLFLSLLAQPRAVVGPSNPASPQMLFKSLFVAVQMAAIFPDGKTFADAVPRSEPAQILSPIQRCASRFGLEAQGLR